MCVVPGEARRGRFLELELQMVALGTKPGHLQELPVLLTARPPLPSQREGLGSSLPYEFTQDEH